MSFVPEQTTTEVQWGVFHADGRLSGTWYSEKAATERLSLYGPGAYIRWRWVERSEWHSLPVPPMMLDAAWLNPQR